MTMVMTIYSISAQVYGPSPHVPPTAILSFDSGAARRRRGDRSCLGQWALRRLTGKRLCVCPASVDGLLALRPCRGGLGWLGLVLFVPVCVNCYLWYQYAVNKARMQ